MYLRHIYLAMWSRIIKWSREDSRSTIGHMVDIFWSGVFYLITVRSVDIFKSQILGVTFCFLGDKCRTRCPGQMI